MKIACIGGGPAGLYFAILAKANDPSHDITVVERNRSGETFGWGVVFSDETLGYLAENDKVTHDRIRERFAYWDDIDVFAKGGHVRSTGHGFCGISRRELLVILQKRAEELGVRLVFETEVDDVSPYLASDLVVACDGLRSKVRGRYEAHFGTTLDLRSARYIWLGTKKHFDAFTFLFEENEHGLFQIHAYAFDKDTSTFIAECDEATFEKSGLGAATPEESIAYLERLFGKHLDGHSLMGNHSSWLRFTTVKNERWYHENVVLMGDSARTAHFSIGSGTKLAMEDAIALANALKNHSALPDALAAYEAERKDESARLQKAAQDSLVWFENVKRHWDMDLLPFVTSLMTRSKRITWENLKLRDPALVRAVGEWVHDHTPGAPPRAEGEPYVPPMFLPFSLRGMTLENRVVVSPMCMYSAHEGMPNDFHFTHYTARAQGGAGLVMTEMTDVSPDARITLGCAGMWSEAHSDAWKRIVDYVHAHTRAKIGMQLGHAGRKGATKLMWEGIDEPLERGAWPLLAPSPLPYFAHSQVPKAMDRADMDRVKQDFVRATSLADRAGFDLLELHLAHGYLLATFLSPLTNTRSDGYGGSREARFRYPLEVMEAVRAAWPKDKPMSVRVSATDWAPGGVEPEDTVALAKALKERGCDLLDVSAGQTVPEGKPIYGRMFQAGFADQVRHEAKVATMAVGNIASWDQINTLVASGRADLCALARPHLQNPHFTLQAAIEQGYVPHFVPPQYAAVSPRPRVG